VEFPCENCLTRSLCKNDAKLRRRSLDYRMIELVDKCPELKNYIFPDRYFKEEHYKKLEQFMNEGDE
jgi:hypothetical protein